MAGRRGMWIPSGVLLWILSAAATGQDLEVGIRRPDRRDLTRRMIITGSVIAFEETAIVARVQGYVEKVHADLGDEVKAGDPLLAISAPELLDRKAVAEAEKERAAGEVRKAREARSIAGAKLAAAEADLEVARAQAEADIVRLEAAAVLRELKRVTHERYSAMKEKQAATPQQVDEAVADLRHSEAQEKLAEAARITSAAQVEMARMRIGVARAELRAAESEIAVREAAERGAAAKLAESETLVGWLTVRAPYEGRVFARHVHRGDFVRGGDGSSPTPLFQFQATGQVRVSFEVPDAEAPQVQAGNGVRITGRGIPGDPIVAKVTRTAGARSSSTRALPVEVHLADDRIRPGMFVSVVIDLDTHRNAIAVPVSAVVSEKRGPSVYVVRNGKAEKVAVTLGVVEPDHVEVVSGLTGDEEIVIRGRDLLSPGMTVTAVRDEPKVPEKKPPGGDGR